MHRYLKDSKNRTLVLVLLAGFMGLQVFPSLANAKGPFAIFRKNKHKNAEKNHQDPQNQSTASVQSGAAQGSAGSLGEKSFRIGVFIDPNEFLEDSRYAPRLEEFNTVFIGQETKLSRLQPNQSDYESHTYHWEKLDREVDWAVAHHKTIHMEISIYHTDGSLPMGLIHDIFKGEGKHQNKKENLQMLIEHQWTPQEKEKVRKYTEEYVRNLVSRYADRVDVWRPTNEIIAPKNEGLRDNFWLRTLGPDHVDWLFRLVHSLDPTATLYLNDFNIESTENDQNRKHQYFYEYVKGLRAKGTPIDGVGLQMHIKTEGEPTVAEFRKVKKKFSDLGFKVFVTEMDVRIKSAGKAQLQAQADRFGEIFGVCLEAPQCGAVIFWGVSDKYAKWIRKTFPGFGDPLLFDDDYQKKPAYFAVKKHLESK